MVQKSMVLAGDIGGTNTRLALFEVGERELPTLNYGSTYESAAFPALEDVISKFMSGSEGQIRAAVFAVAGPVVDGQSTLTNLAWSVSADSLRRFLQIDTVELLNDQAGLAYFVPHATRNDYVRLNNSQAVPRANISIVAPGTGLGEAFLTWTAAGYLPQATEGGHTDFAPVNERQIRLLEFMLGLHKRVSYERVCSGMAIPRLFEFLRDIEGIVEPDWMKDRIRDAADPGPVIFEIAQSGLVDRQLCVEVVKLFVEILAQEAGNVALKTLSLGGLYLAGGIPPKIIPELKTGFMTRFAEKGRMSPLLMNTPVSVIAHPEPTLFGTAIRAAELARNSNE